MGLCRLPSPWLVVSLPNWQHFQFSHLTGDKGVMTSGDQIDNWRKFLDLSWRKLRPIVTIKRFRYAIACKLTLEGGDDGVRIDCSIVIIAGSWFRPIVYSDAPFFVIQSEVVYCYMRSRAFGGIMRYKKLFLLVILACIANGVHDFSRHTRAK